MAEVPVAGDEPIDPLVSARNRWHEFRFSNRSIAQAKANARFHYGHGETFYRYWLDRVGMMYTCAYWKEGTKTVEEAQVNAQLANEGDLAESWSQPNETTYIFKLRKGVKFHDGTEFNADAVVFAFSVIL